MKHDDNDRAGPFLWWSDVPQPFWQEQTPWPYIHYVIALALYVALRNAFVTVLLLYVWESFEQLFVRINVLRNFEREHWDDAWIGDPMMGKLAVLAFAVLDSTFDWRRNFVAFNRPPFIVRAAVFGVQLAVAFWAGSEQVRQERQRRSGSDSNPHVFVMLHIVVYVAAAYAGYAPYWDLSDSMTYMPTIVWSGIAALAALVAVPGRSTTPRCAVYKRVFLFGLAVLLAALVTLIVLA